MSGNFTAIKLDDDGSAEAMGLRNHPGYIGVFTRYQYTGALPNGTRFSKANSEPGDATPNGALGTIMGSIGHPEVGIMYFVEWDYRPGFVVGVVEKKVVINQ